MTRRGASPRKHPAARAATGSKPRAAKPARPRPVVAVGSRRQRPVGVREPREALLEFSMSPLDKGPSVSTYVSRSLNIIDRSGVPYRLNPMGTVLEGTWDEVLGVVTRCFERMAQDCERISVSIKIDWRRDREGRLSGKIASVERRLGRRLRT